MVRLTVRMVERDFKNWMIVVGVGVVSITIMNRMRFESHSDIATHLLIHVPSPPTTTTLELRLRLKLNHHLLRTLCTLIIVVVVTPIPRQPNNTPGVLYRDPKLIFPILIFGILLFVGIGTIIVARVMLTIPRGPRRTTNLSTQLGLYNNEYSFTEFPKYSFLKL